MDDSRGNLDLIYFCIGILYFLHETCLSPASLTITAATHFLPATMTPPVTRPLAFVLCLVSTPASAFLSGAMPRAASRRLVLGAAGELSEDDELASERKAKLRELLSASERQINYLIDSRPHVLEMRNPEEYLRSATTLFRERLGMSEREARNVFVRMPYAPFGQSLEELEAKLDRLEHWFRSLKLSKRKLRRIISTRPFILRQPLKASMAQIDAVQASLQLTDKELQFLVGSPRPVLQSILSTPVKHIRSRIAENSRGERRRHGR